MFYCHMDTIRIFLRIAAILLYFKNIRG
uniref:Uncharacterized protein n=1 Tax=Anguilla anguilla TaxID=7936 RepID=A0A0E9R1B0_ANGAN